MLNWKEYRTDPLYMFAAPLFKPNDDPRSPVQFAADNFFDNVMMIVSKVFGVFLVPVFKIFRLFLDSLTQTSDGLFNIKALLANMWDKWNKIVDPFMRRFQLVFNQFRLTFIKLFSAMQRTMGIAVSTIYAGLSAIVTMLSFIDLLATIIQSALIALFVMVALLPFVFGPFLPLMIIAQIAVSKARSITGSDFCLAKNTKIATSQGVLPIEQIKIGNVLISGATVLGTMKFITTSDDLYDINGVIVSGSHIIYKDGSPYLVKDYKGAIPYNGQPISELYCLITSDHTISVVSNNGLEVFADWEEFSSYTDLEKWHKQVFETLNPGVLYKAPIDLRNLHTESVFSENTQVYTPEGYVPIKSLLPGDWVFDNFGSKIRVNGIVEVGKSEVLGAVPIGDGNYMSKSVWFHDNLEWNQPTQIPEFDVKTEKWYSLFTQTGQFIIKVANQNTFVRDFTDIGPDKIHETYDWVLESLRKQKKHIK
jgi:hypothetical protein